MPCTQICEIASLVMSETVVVTGNESLDPNPSDKVSLQILLRRQPAELFGKPRYDQIVDPCFGQQADLLVERIEEFQPVGLSEHDTRMGREGYHDALAMQTAGNLIQTPENHPMPAMYAIERPDRHGRCHE